MRLQQTCLLVKSKVYNMGIATGLIVSRSCHRHDFLVSDICADPVPHNQFQTGVVMVNMSAHPVAMMSGLLVGRK